MEGKDLSFFFTSFFLFSVFGGVEGREGNIVTFFDIWDFVQ